jgi:S-formylglutathione hydrolase FrmB
MEYKHWRIMIGQRKDGWYYLVEILPNKTFKATYGPFAGPESAEYDAKQVIDVLEKYLEW